MKRIEEEEKARIEEPERKRKKFEQENLSALKKYISF